MHKPLWKVGLGFGLALLVGCKGGGVSDALDGSVTSALDGGIPPHQDTCKGPASAALANARLPDGYCAWTWAGGLAEPRGIEVAGNGDVLVVERAQGKITVLFDGDGDGVSGPNERGTLAQVNNGDADRLNHGIAINGGFLYASSSTKVYRWPYTPGKRTSLGEPNTVVSGIPSGGHVTRTLAFDPNGKLYVSVGSAGNVDPNSNRARIRRFTTQQVEAGNVAFDSGELFADGMRNEAALAFDFQGRLWGAENGRDNLSRGDLGGDIHTDNPAEELNLFSEPGKFYGYPYCWTEFLLPAGVGMGPKTQWADPTFMNDGTHTDAWCRDTNNVVPPKLAMPAHVAPLDLTFYRGGSFPDDVVGDAFVGFHGSWNREPAQGYEVVRVIFENGSPVRYESFLEYDSSADKGAGWPHRPVGVRVGARGELFITSDDSGVIIAVGHP